MPAPKFPGQTGLVLEDRIAQSTVLVYHVGTISVYVYFFLFYKYFSSFSIFPLFRKMRAPRDGDTFSHPYFQFRLLRIALHKLVQANMRSKSTSGIFLMERLCSLFLLFDFSFSLPLFEFNLRLKNGPRSGE